MINTSWQRIPDKHKQKQKKKQKLKLKLKQKKNNKEKKTRPAANVSHSNIFLYKLS